MQGRLIVFEGVEGCGKTTQVKRSLHWLKQDELWKRWWEKTEGAPLWITRQPGGTAIGLELRQLLLHSKEDISSKAELLLYAADRAQHVDKFLKPAIAKGALILCDRYTLSTLAYQGYGRGLSKDLINQMNAIATGGLEPDLTIWIDVDVEVGLRRAKQIDGGDRIEQASLDFHRRVQYAYWEAWKESPDKILRIDGDRPEDAVFEDIQGCIGGWMMNWLDGAIALK